MTNTQPTAGRVNIDGGRTLEYIAHRAPLWEGAKSIAKNYSLITAEQLAAARIHGKAEQKPLYGTVVVGENANYGNTKAGEILIATQPLNVMLKNMDAVRDAHSQGLDYHLSPETYSILRELAKADPEEAMNSGVLALQRKQILDVPSNRLGEHPLTQFLFRSQAEKYGHWLQERGVETITQRFWPAGEAAKHNQPFALDITLLGMNRNPKSDNSSIESWSLSSVPNNYVIVAREKGTPGRK
jgi:hypothetical protein